MDKEKKRVRLRPVVYTTNSRSKSGANNTTQQMFLLKALKITQDPKKLKDMIGVRTVAEVYRTLDKLAMRKEFHAALARSGISFDYITKGIKEIADCSEKDDTRLKAFQTLLKSVGMEKYDLDTQANTGTWEEILLKKIEEEKDETSEKEPTEIGEYKVIEPVIPEAERLIQEEEKDVTGSIYDTK